MLSRGRRLQRNQGLDVVLHVLGQCGRDIRDQKHETCVKACSQRTTIPPTRRLAMLVATFQQTPFICLALIVIHDWLPEDISAIVPPIISNTTDPLQISRRETLIHHLTTTKQLFLDDFAEDTLPLLADARIDRYVQLFTEAKNDAARSFFSAYPSNRAAVLAAVRRMECWEERFLRQCLSDHRIEDVVDRLTEAIDPR